MSGAVYGCCIYFFILSEYIISNNGNFNAIIHCMHHYHGVKLLPLLCGRTVVELLVMFVSVDEPFVTCLRVHL